MTQKRLAGQVAWISGAASGMAEATARLFAAEGAKVAGPDGVEAVIELPIDEIRQDIDRSAAIIKEGLTAAGQILQEEFGIT